MAYPGLFIFKIRTFLFLKGGYRLGSENKLYASFIFIFHKTLDNLR